MQRRGFVRFVASAAAGYALALHAQETGKIKRIGVTARADIICAVIGHIAVAVSGAGALPQDYCKSALTKSAHLSPIMMLGAFVLPETSLGMMLATAI